MRLVQLFTGLAYLDLPGLKFVTAYYHSTSMNTTFTVKPTPKLLFGAGSLASLPELASSFGPRLVLITGRESFTRSSAWAEIDKALNQERITSTVFSIPGEPSPEDIDTIVVECRIKKPDAVVAIGGGSVLDSGKAVSAMLKEEHPVTEFLEGVGSRTPSGRKLPFIAVPTTSGTGSEATANAVISKPGPEGFKKSLRHEKYVPDIALIDPALTLTCPAPVTAACGMDCYSQLVEAYLSTNANPYTDVLALDGIRRVMRALPKLLHTPDDIESRSMMAYATYLSGIVLANAGLGTVHGFASVLGGYFDIPHGVVCATLMAETNRVTLKKLMESGENPEGLEKYRNLSTLLAPGEGSGQVDAHAFIDNLFEVTEQLKPDTLGKYGITSDDLAMIAEKSGNKYNPVQLDQDEMCEILRNRV